MTFVDIIYKIMKNKAFLFTLVVGFALSSCSNNETTPAVNEAASSEVGPGQSAVVDETSSPNIVQVAVGSKDHTTLVTAVKAAELVMVKVLAGGLGWPSFAAPVAAYSKTSSKPSHIR